MKSVWMQLFFAFILFYLFIEWIAQKSGSHPLKRNPAKLLQDQWFWPLIWGTIQAGATYTMVAKWSLWWPPLVIFAFHAIIGYLHLIFKQDNFGIRLTRTFAQIAVRLILFLALYAVGAGVPVWAGQYPTITSRIIIFLLVLVLLFPAGGALIGDLMEPFQTQLDQSRRAKEQETKQVVPPSSRKSSLQRALSQILGFPETKLGIPSKAETQPEPNHYGFTNGGLVIGYLERLLIFVFVLTNQFAGIGFLVAAKSIFRFGEFKESANRMEAEYIIIGTFSSFLYAILISRIAAALMK